jgi:NAD(P)-dependent dehydrogenase (short-subunit alcohol dehydrogenase family)
MTRDAGPVPPALPPIGAGSPRADRFAGLDCLVTGAGGGIGRAAALRLAAEGGRVIATDIDLAAAEETARAGGPGVIARGCDVRSAGSVAALAAAVGEAFGGLDVLVNNAGIEILGSIEETTPESWDEVMAVNLKGVFLVSRALLGHLAARAAARGGAAIVNNASLMGLVSSPRLAAYCASKAGVVSLTRSMALDHADINLRVNCVCPGIVHTAMLERRFALQADRQDAWAAANARPPLGHIGRPEDVAAAIAYLASPEARFVTGAALTIDGGVGAA